MIKCLVGSLGGVVVILGLLAQLGYLATISCNRILACNRTREKIVDRMEAYALLKPPSANGGFDQQIPNRLTTGAHEVLLGTLKKIEAKSAVLSAILVFAIGAFLAYGFSGTGNQVPQKMFATGVIALLLLPLAFSFVGIRHLDMTSISGFDWTTRRELATRLQADLMQDLLCKESSFRFSLRASAIVIIMAIVIIVFDAIVKTCPCA